MGNLRGIAPAAGRAAELNGQPRVRSRATVRVEKGWVVVCRETPSGLLEWQVVLAEASDPAEPEVTIEDPNGALAVNYRGYFVRETSAGGRLRIYRELKTEDSPAWPTIEFADRDQRRPRTAQHDPAGRFMETWDLDYWTWLECGTISKRPDVSVRLRPATERAVGITRRRTDVNSPFRTPGGPMEVPAYDSYAAEEGDLLVVLRDTPDTAERGLTARPLNDWLQRHERALDAPPITARKWLNDSAGPLLLRDHLQDAVTVVCFWSAACEPSIKALVRLEDVHRKYAKQGLKAIGIQVAAPEVSEPAVRKVLEDHAITLPVMIDRNREGERPAEVRFIPGETAERYLVDILPAFFLIDKSGKLIVGFATAPPTDLQIEAALK